MKKIVIDARESGTTSGRYIDKLVEYLHSLSPEYEMVVITKKHRVDFMKGIAPSFEVVMSPYKEFGFDEQTRLLKQLRSLKADLVHFGMVQQPVLYRGKTVTTMHDLTTARFRNPAKNWLAFTIKQQVYKWVNIYVARKSERVITPTEFVKDDVAKYAHINSRKITVTLESADRITDEPEAVNSLDDTSKFLMYVWRPQPHKNLERLVKAFVMLKDKHPDLKLVLVGKTDAEYRRLAKNVESTNIENVVFTDCVSEGQLRWLYEHTAAYVFPSLSEGFGLPPLEAMMHGAPVVSSKATCLPEVNGDAAEYFDPYEPYEIASAVARVIDNPARGAKLRELGSEQVKKYSWKKMAQETLSIYKDILG